MRLRTAAISVLLPAALLAGWYFNPFERYDPEPWLADYAVLRDWTSEGYANLESALDRRLVDPWTLNRLTEQKIRNAGSDRAATAALREFTAAFQDGHFHLRRDPPRAVVSLLDWWYDTGDKTVEPSLDGPTACRRMGFDNRDDAGLLAAAGGFRRLAGAPFPTGTVRSPAGETIGVVRIPLFGQDGYLDECAAEWERFRATLPDGPCDEECGDRFWYAVSDRLLARLAQRVRELEAAGASRLVVDITGNGGGSEWVEAVARVLTPHPLPAPRAGIIRHPHHVRSLEQKRRDFAAERARDDLTAAEQAMLDSAMAATDRALGLVRAGCDRRAIWTDSTARLECSLLVEPEIGTRYARPGTLDRLATRGLLFTPAMFHYEEGAWRGPLYVLADRGTASASELFIAMLADAGAATIVGGRTYGAGCGYTNGGLDIVLPNSGFRVRMPDCVRLRADGTNEVAGIAPDLDAGWEEDDDDAERAAKALAAIYGESRSTTQRSASRR